MGQCCVLQWPFSSAGPAQSLPPCLALCWTRFLTAFPPPHVFEHALQSCQSSDLQSTGHGSRLHFSCFELPPVHFLPPAFTSTLYFRVVVCCPPPHVFVHLLHSAQSSQTQSTGQDASLHFAVSFSGWGHASPLYFGCTSTFRCLDVVPPPHFLEHSVQEDQWPTLQSTGQ